MEKLIPQYYREYGMYSNTRKMLPSIIDGLLPVQRRILLTAHTIAKNKYVKTAKILGECMARWHPHSEAKGTAVWAVQNKFADGDGQWGSNIGIDSEGAAAPRYTSMKANKFIEELAFKYVNYVKWEIDESDPEPVAIPTMIPFCLMALSELSSIAFGFKTDIPCYELSDLILRLLYLKDIGDKVIIRPKATGCKVLSSDEDCEKLLMGGTGKISVQGEYIINEAKRCVIIKGWSPRQVFETSLLNRIDKYKDWGLLSNGDIGYNDDSTGDVGTTVTFDVAKSRNKDKVFERMCEAIPEVLKNTISFNMYVVDDGSVKISSVDEMLLRAYSCYSDAFKNYLNKSIEALDVEIEDLKTIKKIRPHVSSATKNLASVDEICNILSKKSHCDKVSIQRVMSKYKIRKLISVSLDIDELEEKKEKFVKGLENSEKLCIDKYQKIAQILE